MAKAEWPFDDPPNVATITVRQIVHGGQPVLLVTRDAEDGGWQFLTGGACEVADGMVLSLQNMFEHDPTVAELADMPPGSQATRGAVGKPWHVSKRPTEYKAGPDTCLVVLKKSEK